MQKQQQQQQHFKSFEIVWARFGKTFHPATFLNCDWVAEFESQAPPNISDQHVPVRWFGSWQTSFILPTNGNILPYKCMPKMQAPSKKFQIAASEAAILHRESLLDKHIVPMFWDLVRNPDECAVCSQLATNQNSQKCCSCGNPWHFKCHGPRVQNFVCPECDGRESRRGEIFEELRRINPAMWGQNGEGGEQVETQKKQQQGKDEEEERQPKKKKKQEEGEGVRESGRLKPTRQNERQPKKQKQEDEEQVQPKVMQEEAAAAAKAAVMAAAVMAAAAAAVAAVAAAAAEAAAREEKQNQPLDFGNFSSLLETFRKKLTCLEEKFSDIYTSYSCSAKALTSLPCTPSIFPS